MKLLTKTTLFFLTIAMFVLFAGGILFYFSFRYLINREVKRELIADMHQIILNPPVNKLIGMDSLTFDLPVHYRIVPILEINTPRFVFCDTLLFDNVMKRYQPYLILRFETSLGGKPVHISISKSMLIADELIKYVAFVTLLLSLILLFGITVFNKFFFSYIWGSFFKTITVIKDYNIADVKEISFPESEIAEFNRLNQVLEKMHERIKQDYQNLKEFIENLSHEIQTPLAIINSKVDLLQQIKGLDKSGIKLIQSIHGSAIRLSNLNKSLIILTKIDNNQFPESEDVDIVENISLHLHNFEDIIQLKNISLQKNYKNTIVVKADSNLISIMILNLLKNSIYHNLVSGTIEIITEQKTLIIKNSGTKPDISHEDIFKRFTRSSYKLDSLGLGLAIVKKICDYYHYSIRYSYRDSFHSITISFM